MEKYIIKEAIPVFYITASSFPDGIDEAFQKLNALLPSASGRKFYGISNPNKSGKIIYKAAVEEAYAGEAEKYGCATFVIPGGEYVSELVRDYEKDISIVAATFQKLLAQPGVTEGGFCLEMYLGEKDMQCLAGPLK